MRGLNQRVDHALFVVRSCADDHRPRQIGAVAVQLSAKIEQEPLSGRHHAVAGPGMRKRGAWAGGDDRRKRMPLAATPPEGRLERRGDVLFGPPRPNERQDLRQGVLGQVGRGPDCRDLLARLDHSQAAPPGRSSSRLARASDPTTVARREPLALSLYAQAAVGSDARTFPNRSQTLFWSTSTDADAPASAGA